MRLTAEAITGALSYLNPLNERELDLRGHKIPSIENLGAAQDQECIDLTDNNIAALANFPRLPRLQTLLCAQNRISTISASLSSSLPNLTTLVLTNNNLRELADLNALQGFSKLTHISLIGNPVTSKENYRYWVLWQCPKIRFFDFQKVKDQERSKAKELFGQLDSPTDLARSILATRSHVSGNANVSSLSNGSSNGRVMKVTEEEKKRFQVLVQKAKTLAEVQRLERAFNEGRLPAAVIDGDAMDET